MNEEQWESAIKNLENAMRIHRNRPEYNFALGQCYMQMNKIKDAVIYFSNFIKARPKNIKGWKELFRCLYEADFFEEALQQVQNAIKTTDNKPILFFYKSAALFALGRSKEALLQLETGMDLAPKLLKQLVEMEPSLLQHNQVIELLAKYKKNRIN